MSNEQCNEPAAPLIPRRGESFACVLPKGHDGPHRPGGTCFKHGAYVGEAGVPPRCPRGSEGCIPDDVKAEIAAQPTPAAVEKIEEMARAEYSQICTCGHSYKAHNNLHCGARLTATETEVVWCPCEKTREGILVEHILWLQNELYESRRDSDGEKWRKMAFAFGWFLADLERQGLGDALKNPNGASA